MSNRDFYDYRQGYSDDDEDEGDGDDGDADDVGWRESPSRKKKLKRENASFSQKTGAWMGDFIDRFRDCEDCSMLSKPTQSQIQVLTDFRQMLIFMKN